MDLSRTVALVDGANIARADGKPPRIELLLAIRRALGKAGFGDVEVVCDATLRHVFRKLSPEQYDEFESGIRLGLWSQTPFGEKADRIILQRVKLDENAVVVSNDAFARPQDGPDRPTDLEDRRIRVQFYKDRLQLIFPRQWPEAVTVIEPYGEFTAADEVGRTGVMGEAETPSYRSPALVGQAGSPPPPSLGSSADARSTPFHALYWLAALAALVIALVVIAALAWRVEGDHRDQRTVEPPSTPRATSIDRADKCSHPIFEELAHWAILDRSDGRQLPQIRAEPLLARLLSCGGLDRTGALAGRGNGTEQRPADDVSAPAAGTWKPSLASATRPGQSDKRPTDGHLILSLAS